MSRLSFLYAVAFIALLFACTDNKKQESTNTEVISSDTIVKEAPVNKDSLLTATGSKLLNTLKSKNYSAFSSLFRSDTKVRFSPYGYVDTLTNKSFTKQEFDALVAGNKKIHWGSYDGSGDSILLTAQQYIDKFVYNADFLNAEKTAIDSFIGSGNSLNNLKKVYPGARFIEYHFSGFDKKYGGMDWTSLRLVFREMNQSYRLIAIVHDQWTS